MSDKKKPTGKSKGVEQAPTLSPKDEKALDKAWGKTTDKSG